MSDPVVLLSTGDVAGPAGGVTDNSMVLFSGTSGKLIKGNNAVVTAAGLALLDDVDAAAQRTTLQLKTGAVTNKTTFNTDPTVGSLIKVGDFGVGGMLDLRGTVFVTGKPQDLYSKGFVKGFADGGPAGLAIPGLVSTSYGVLELDAHWSEPSGAGGIMRSFTQGGVGVVYTQTMVNATTWGPWIATWNTSNLVKTASSTDTTAGSMLKVGDFGLGTTAVHYGGDLNLLGNVTGFYRIVSGATNFPNGCMDSCFVHIGSGDTYSQTIVGYGSNRMYTRGGVGVVPNISWQPWVSIAKTNSETFTGTTTFSGDTDTSGFVRRFKGGNTTTANQGLGVSSDGSFGEHCFGARAYGNVAGYACYLGRVDGVNPTFASWYYYGSPVGTITTNGSSTSYNTTSDYRLKADVTDLGYSLERIQGLKPKAYRWLSTDKWGAGFLAHELAVVMPDAVTGEKDAVKSILDEAGEVIGEEVVPQVVDYSKIVVYLVGAIQEQQAQIDSLVSRIAKLEDTTA